MGSSKEDPKNGLDIYAGGLVWVRRRNGSWWPGRIIGADEMPEGCAPTPRSGNPVKLLGREDASVDWYNIEKSKRIKPFRCGDYDDCIEKAKASASPLSRKAVKYARREDAILQALELENARHIEECKDINAVLSNSDSAPELSHSGVSFQEPHYTKEEPKRRRKTPNDSEEDGIEGVKVKRMRGLEDLGVGVSSSLRRNRSQAAHVHEFLKKKNRRRPLAKLMESTAMNNNSDRNGVSFENAVSSSILRPSDASLESKSKESEISSIVGISENESSNRLFDVPLVAEEKPSAADTRTPQKIPDGSGAYSSQSSYVEIGNLEQIETCSTSSATTDVHNVAHTIENATSEWQLKGKRNCRSRKTGRDDIVEESLDGSSNTTRLLPYRQSRLNVNPKYDSSNFSLTHHTENSGLHDVSVEVKTSYSKQHLVPYVSLMSKSSGQPIIGHPLSIKALDDDDDDEILGFFERCSNIIYEQKPRARPPRLKSRSSLRKGTKGRRNGLMSKKIRTLSSLTNVRRLSRGLKKAVVEKKVKGPSIACVPLSVVFSRINAALNGSIRPATRV